VDNSNQILIPESFTALFLSPGRAKPTEPYDTIVQRYELCEDLSCALVEQATTQKWSLGVESVDIVERIVKGLSGEAAVVNDAEAAWIGKRLLELMG
jgi:hypothetical protein